MTQNTYSWRVIQGAERIQARLTTIFQALLKQCFGHTIDVFVSHFNLTVALRIC